MIYRLERRHYGGGKEMRKEKQMRREDGARGGRYYS